LAENVVKSGFLLKLFKFLATKAMNCREFNQCIENKRFYREIKETISENFVLIKV